MNWWIYKENMIEYIILSNHQNNNYDNVDEKEVDKYYITHL